MKNIKIQFFIVLLVSGVLFSNQNPNLKSEILDEPNTGAWPCFGQNQYHTGQANVSIPDANISIAWTYHSYGAIRGGIAVDHNKRIYFGSEDGWLYCLNDDGSLVWKENTYGSIKTVPIISGEGNIYIGNDNKYMHCFYHDGFLKWKLYTNTAITGSPTLDDYNTIYFGTTAGIYVIRDDGSLKWAKSIGSNVVAPTLGRKNGIFVCSKNHVYMFEKDGSNRWGYYVYYNYFPAAIDNDGNLYFAGTDKMLYCHNPEAKEIIWYYSLGGTTRCTPALDSSGNILIGTNEYKMHCIKPDGTQAWTFIADDKIVTQAIIDIDNNVVFTTKSGWVFALTKDGSLKWSYNLSGDIEAESAITASGLILIGQVNGDLVALSGTTGFERKKTAFRMSKSFNLRILGNPVRKVLRLQYCAETNGKISIYSIQGKKIVSELKTKPGKHRLNWTIPQNLSNGVYLLHFSNHKKTLEKTIIIMH